MMTTFPGLIPPTTVMYLSIRVTIVAEARLAYAKDRGDVSRLIATLYFLRLRNANTRSRICSFLDVGTFIGDFARMNL